MKKPNILVKKKLLFIMGVFSVTLIILFARIFYIQTIRADFLQTRAYEQQTRDRLIAPNRGSILDRNMVPVATTETVASISVIHNQLEDEEEVARVLSEKLEMDYNEVLEKVSRRVALERIQTKVDKDLADEIGRLGLKGVVIDEDIRRVYPYSNLASQVIGFVGSDNQGIVGLEARYEEYLKGTSGKILTETDVRGREVSFSQSYRIPPVDGYHLVTSLDVVMQQYAEQTLQKAVENKEARRGSIILMNPQNGEIYAMANYPDFDLNQPFTINNSELEEQWPTLTYEERNNHLNQMWRNFSINDTYEPGSTFKIITAAAGMEEGLVTLDTMFTCNGYHVVGGRQVKCWRFPRNHGSLNFIEGIKVSCNPVFMKIAEDLGAEVFYEYLIKFGLNQKTGIDLPGEAVGIMHNLENVGPLELATMSFGQSFQITPLQLLTSVSTVINGGYRVTPNVGVRLIDNEGAVIENLEQEQGEQIISTETSELMKTSLERVVYEGTGNKTYIPGYRIGGKTATSEKLPRGNGKYVASFLAFAPAENPQVLALVLIDEPQGVYYGGQVAGPIMNELLTNVLPYLGIEPIYNEEELLMDEVVQVEVPNLVNMPLKDAQTILQELELEVDVMGEGEIIISQFPISGDYVNKGENIKIYLHSSN